MQTFVRLAAAASQPVLLTGPTGSGKSHAARLIHGLGARARKPIVPANCAAIPHELFEAELFGHTKGAYTGATESAAGLIAAADGGTLVLEEVGDMPPAVQPKLLRFLDDGAVRHLGSTRYRHVDVRVISTANRDLATMVRRQVFRADLFFRLAVLECRMPSLAERNDDLPGLIRRYIASKDSHGTIPLPIDEATLTQLRSYGWPGGIRELHGVLDRALLYADAGPIRPEHLPERIRRPADDAAADYDSPRARGRRRYAAPKPPGVERHQIVHVLRREAGNRTRAAASLGMARSTLWAKLRQYGIDADQYVRFNGGNTSARDQSSGD